MYGKIVETIKSAIAVYEKNNRPNYVWKEPVIEIISAQNEELPTLKHAVSPEHLMPPDILADAKSIISFFLPFDDRVVKSNIGGVFASREWARCYIQTNDLIKTINDEIEILMKKSGNKTGKIPATHNFDVDK
jgi:epoxyqueuosine reductase QueG